MTQNDRELEALYRALLSAFPSEGALERMLRFGMGLNRAEIASGNLSNQVFDVIRFAEARGQIDQLIRSAIAANPGNADLKAVAELRAQTVVTQGAPTVNASVAAAKVDKLALRNAIQESYTLEELQLLCADLQEHLKTRGREVRLSFDDIAGATKAIKVLNLIEFLDRRRLLDVLVETIRNQRPGSV
jgi:hypothetical protein